MANYHNLLSKADRALVAFLVAGKAGTLQDVVPAKWAMGRPLPLTICHSSRGHEAAPYSGTYVVASSIMVRSGSAQEIDADEQEARLASEERVAQTFDLFHTDIDSAGDKMADDITAAARALAIEDPKNYGDLADFTVQDVTIKGIDAGFEEGTLVWTDSIELELLCCPSDVSEP